MEFGDKRNAKTSRFGFVLQCNFFNYVHAFGDTRIPDLMVLVKNSSFAALVKGFSRRANQI